MLGDMRAIVDDIPLGSRRLEIGLTLAWYNSAQPALGVIGNIAFPLSRNKGRLKGPPSPEAELTRSPPAVQGLSSNEDSHSVPRLSHPSLIELIFC